MPSVDTNVILRWLLDDVPEHTARATALLRSGPRFAVDDATMIEVVYVLERVLRLARPTVADAILTILSEAALVPDRAHWRSTIDTYRNHPKLPVTDIHLALRAAEEGERLYTFDARLARQLDAATLA